MSQILIVAEHSGGRLNQSTARCVSCALQIDPAGADVVVLSGDCREVAGQAARLQGVRRVRCVERPENEAALAAVLAPQIAALASDYAYVLGPSTTFGKDLMPRVAALLGVGQVSDLMSVEGPRRFKRPVYAGNAVDGGTGLVLLAAYNNEQLRENFFNQTDLTFSAETGSVGHEFLVGLELGEQVTENLRMTGLFNGTDLNLLVPATDPMVSVPVTFAPTELDNDNRGRATIAAVYVQDQVQLSQKWLAVVGLRYDNFDLLVRETRDALGNRASTWRSVEVHD